MPIQVQVRYFASLREALGPQQSLSLPEGVTVGQARDRLIASSPQHAQALSRSRTLRAALNQVMCDESRVVTDGAELAFFPPVTGG